MSILGLNEFAELGGQFFEYQKPRFFTSCETWGLFSAFGTSDLYEMRNLGFFWSIGTLNFSHIAKLGESSLRSLKPHRIPKPSV